MFVLKERRVTKAAMATKELAVAMPIRKTQSKRAPPTMDGFGPPPQPGREALGDPELRAGPDARTVRGHPAPEQGDPDERGGGQGHRRAAGDGRRCLGHGRA